MKFFESKNKIYILLLFCSIISCKNDEIEPNVSQLLETSTIYYLFYNQEISIQDFIDSGLSVKKIFDELIEGTTRNTSPYKDYYWQEVFDNGFSQDFIDAGFSINDLLDEGINMEDLYFYGITIQQFIESGLSFKEIIVGTAKITTLDFVKLKLPTEKLIEEGLIEATPLPGFYIMNYLHNPIGHFNKDINTLDIINNNIIGMNNWRVPTIAELKYIYNNRSLFDLKIDNLKLYTWDNRPDNISVEYLNYWISSTLENSCVSSLPYPVNLNFENGIVSAFCSGSRKAYFLPVIQL